MLRLSSKWISELSQKPETGIGYQIATVHLKGGVNYAHVTIVEGTITEIRGIEGIPFAEDDIERIDVTHDK